MTTKQAYELRYEPSKFNTLENAKSYAEGCIKYHCVMLGDDHLYWVVCFGDAQRLAKKHIEYAY